MFYGKRKAVTFSYDDGVTQDIRLAALFHKYGLKATFNLNSDRLGKTGQLIRDGKVVRHDKNHAADLRLIYEGHEIAAHTLNHPLLPSLESEAEIVRQVEEDRLRLSELAGYEVIGFAYPGGGINYDSRVSRIIREKTGIRYARTTVSTYGFVPQDDLFEFKPTAYHHRDMDRLFELAEQFLADDGEDPLLFYIWGHAYEFDIFENWDRFEELCKLLSGHSDVFYGTNREVLLP